MRLQCIVPMLMFESLNYFPKSSFLTLFLFPAVNLFQRWNSRKLLELFRSLMRYSMCATILQFCFVDEHFYEEKLGDREKKKQLSQKLYEFTSKIENLTLNVIIKTFHDPNMVNRRSEFPLR